MRPERCLGQEVKLRCSLKLLTEVWEGLPRYRRSQRENFLEKPVEQLLAPARVSRWRGCQSLVGVKGEPVIVLNVLRALRSSPCCPEHPKSLYGGARALRVWMGMRL